MAREATARLYDVNEDSLVFKRLTHTGRYDTGTITFQAKKGKLIDLDNLHESVWATRLSGGTRSGLVRLDITLNGRVVRRGTRLVMLVDGSDAQIVLAKDIDKEEKEESAKSFAQLEKALSAGKERFTVTGRVDGWKGRWPQVLRKPPPRPHRILVNKLEVDKES